jgi:hypothetical protein
MIGDAGPDNAPPMMTTSAVRIIWPEKPEFQPKLPFAAEPKLACFLYFGDRNYPIVSGFIPMYSSGGRIG